MKKECPHCAGVGMVRGGDDCPACYGVGYFEFKRRDMSAPDPHDPRTPVYEERNRLVALLAAIYPSSLERHPDEDEEWEDDWRWVVFIDLPGPTGPQQASWHIHDSHLPLFQHVARSRPGLRWDGHTTAQKYFRVEVAIQELHRNKGSGRARYERTHR